MNRFKGKLYANEGWIVRVHFREYFSILPETGYDILRKAMLMPFRRSGVLGPRLDEESTNT